MGRFVCVNKNILLNLGKLVLILNWKHQGVSLKNNVVMNYILSCNYLVEWIIYSETVTLISSLFQSIKFLQIFCSV